MHERRTTYGVAVRLALVFSTVAALVAMALHSIGGVSTSRLVVAVVVIGFVTSWVQTGRVTRSAAIPTGRRISVMPLRQPIG